MTLRRSAKSYNVKTCLVALKVNFSPIVLQSLVLKPIIDCFSFIKKVFLTPLVFQLLCFPCVLLSHGRLWVNPVTWYLETFWKSYRCHGTWKFVLNVPKFKEFLQTNRRQRAVEKVACRIVRKTQEEVTSDTPLLWRKKGAKCRAKNLMRKNKELLLRQFTTWFRTRLVSLRHAVFPPRFSTRFPHYLGIWTRLAIGMV